ncbi:MAG TPA: proton-conducting transporter membrane subunit [Candidatus Dormibacteraeota bacterium]|jgi:NADH-quinone oxidoreductase subunit L|nr:proton-conducting transporter membrane subunit [Candidatus Dormibacteraeota bacterium]
MYNLAWAVVLLPLGGFLFAFLPESPRRAAQVCITFTAAAFVVSMILLLYRVAHVKDNPYQALITFWTFDPGTKLQGGFISDFHAQIGVLVDNLSCVMMAVVSLVSLLVQVYATGFLRRDEGGYTRHFAGLVMATFAMLALVASPNLFGLWVFWELLGVCFYVLVAHWWDRPEAAAAARRMFLITRIGDLALLLGLVFVFAKFAASVAQVPAAAGQTATDPFNFFVMEKQFSGAIAGHVAGTGPRTLIILALLVLLAAAAKSALLPLHTWVGRVFEEAPAPVTALLSTVTMSAAGVYLVARMYPLFEVAPHVASVMAVLGALTAVIAAAVAVAQNDIRRLLAWSTTSQVGLMFAALGTGAYSAAIFQMITHAWAKAALVLAAGSLVAAYRTTDIREMSGAWQHMRATSRALAVAAASAAGVVLLAGFWSLGAILAGVMRNQFPNGAHVAGWVQALVVVCVALTVLLGAVAPMRMFFQASLGELPRRRGFQPQRVREVGARVVRPTALLAGLAALGGFMGIPGVRAGFSHFVFAGTTRGADDHALAGLVVVGVLAVAGAGVAWAAHTGRVKVPSTGRAGALVAGGLRLDAAYDWAVANTVLRAAPVVATVDDAVRERVLDEVGEVVETAAEAGRRWQVGRIDAVTVSAFAGVVLVAGAVVLGATGHLPFTGATR